MSHATATLPELAFLAIVSAVHYYGAAGRCANTPEYKTSISWSSESQYIALCPKHAGQDGGSR